MKQARPRLEQVSLRPEEVRTPGEPWPRVRRVAVVRNDRLGDLVLTLPAIAALDAAYPDAWIGLVVKPVLAPLARAFEVVDEVVEDRGGDEDLADAFRSFAPDLVVSVAPGARAGWAALRARVPHRVGPGYRIFSPMFERTVDERRHAGARHEAEYALSFAHKAGARGAPARFPIRRSEEAEASLEGWLQAHQVEGRFVVLHPGSGGSCPAWPASRFARLATLLIGEGAGVVFSVGPTDEEAARALDAAPGPIRRAARFSGDLPTLTALLRRAAVVVSNSTGPLHLAAAVGTPALAFHAPWPTCGVSRWGPYAANGFGLVADLPEAMTWSRSERRRLGEDLLATITPAVALSCVLAMWEGRRPEVP